MFCYESGEYALIKILSTVALYYMSCYGKLPLKQGVYLFCTFTSDEIKADCHQEHLISNYCMSKSTGVTELAF